MKTFQTLMMFVAGIFLLASCATSSVNLKVLVPADINIPSHIKKVVIANRSLPVKKNRG